VGGVTVGRLDDVHDRLIDCRACPRLVEWRERIALEKRRAFVDEKYWGRPVPGFGDPAARIIVVGLAPAAHGANRTGRMFTGDRSGDWLFGSLHRQGLAELATSEHAGDGQRLHGVFITSAVHCAPPDNRPTTEERATCLEWTVEELTTFPEVAVIVALGNLGYSAVMRMAPRLGWTAPRPRPGFGHGLETALERGPAVIASYHPSQQNTFTGKLTEPMLDAVLSRAKALADR
jgi:uracil-DNA glycosylase family 4